MSFDPSSRRYPAQQARRPTGRAPAPPFADAPTVVFEPIDDATIQFDKPVVVEPESLEPAEDAPEIEAPEEKLDDQKPVAARPTEGIGFKIIRGFGEAFITLGIVMLLLVVYEIYVTDLISAGKQNDATHALDDQWGSSNTVETPEAQRKNHHNLIEGQAFAKIYIPSFGLDYKFSIVEGTTDEHLEIGPGHYSFTVLPGKPGNFGVAGHRVGKGAPFNDLDLLQSCDAIVVETQTQWFVYRVLPMSSEVAGWSNGKGKTAECEKVAPLGGLYAKAVGQQIVSPGDGLVLNDVPSYNGQPPAELAKLMTLTTCHPKFSNAQRLIIHAVLTREEAKTPGYLPPEMKGD